jgi:hypothetical protein
MFAVSGKHCWEWSWKSGRTRPIAASAIAPALLYYRTSMCISLRTVVRNAG